MTELTELLQSRFGIELPSTFVFNDPTIDAMSRHISGILVPAMDCAARDLAAFVEDQSAMAYAEQRLLAIHLQDPNSKNFHNWFRVKFPIHIDLQSNLSCVLESLPVMRTRFVNNEAIEDVQVVVRKLTCDDIQARNDILFAPFNLATGPLCRFGIDNEKNILIGCVHHSIFDGRSMKIFLDAISIGKVKASTKEYTVRKFAAYEALAEVQNEYRSSAIALKEILGDTPPRLEVDFSHGPMSHAFKLTLDCEIVQALRAFCRKEQVSMFIVALQLLHHTMRAYSRAAYAIGISHDTRPGKFRDTVGMFVNWALVPFRGGKKGGTETPRQLQIRWMRDIFPHAKTPSNLLTSMGYGCNINLAFDVGIFGSGGSMWQFENLDYVGDHIDAKRDLSVFWLDGIENDGSFEVLFESGLGKWPGLEDVFLQAIDLLLDKGIH